MAKKSQVLPKGTHEKTGIIQVKKIINGKFSAIK